MDRSLISASLVAVLVLGGQLAYGQSEPTDSRLHGRPQTRYRISTEVHVRLDEYFEEDEHPHYEQAGPAVARIPTGTVSWSSGCHWIPQEEPLYPLPPFRPARDGRPPDSLFDAVRFSSVGKFMRFDFGDLPSIPDGPSGDPRYDPTYYGTPPASETIEAPDGTDDVLLYGPEIELGFGPALAGWLPAPFHLSAHARALFGRAEIGGESSDLGFYSAGLRLSAQLLENRGFTLGAYAAAGPGWLRTDHGEATGIDTALGGRAEWSVSDHLSLSAGLEGNGFFSDGLNGLGIGLTIGLDLGW